MGRRMMIFAEHFKSASPTILTVAAIGGLVATVVSAFKAAPEVESRLEEAKEEQMTTMETVVHVAPTVAPTAGFAVGTAMCIIGSNFLNKKQQMSLASSYAVVERLYHQYRGQVRDILGIDSDKEIIQEIAKKKIEKDPPPNDDDDDDDGKKLYYDVYGDRYFRRTPTEVLQAHYDLNRHLANNLVANLNDYYNALGLSPTDFGKDHGWNVDELWLSWDSGWVDFYIVSGTTDDGLEYEIPYFVAEPSNKYLDDPPWDED